MNKEVLFFAVIITPCLSSLGKDAKTVNPVKAVLPEFNLISDVDGL